jgi:hypothetical protein
MRQEAILTSIIRRVSVPSNLAMVGLVGGLFCVFQLYFRLPTAGLMDFTLPFLLLFGHLALGPVPWQWTGDDRDLASLGRGFAQALGFGVVWISLVLFSLHLLGRADDGLRPLPRPDRIEPRAGPQDGPPPFPLQGPQPGAFQGPPGPRPEPSASSQGPSGPAMEPAMPSQAAQAEARRSEEPRSMQRPGGRPFRPGLALGLVNLAAGIAFGWVYAAKEATEAGERRTAGLLRQSQAKALQNQLDPHVLYNALNGLAELVHEDPLAAEEMIAMLADLYRRLTVHGETALIRLEQERRLVEAYLDMEQMRLGDRLRVSWNWLDWADQVMLPPYFLLPLVENAIKHGISPAEAGGEVAIACARDGARILLRVENTGAALGPGRPGVGLGNLEARLRLWTELEGSFKLEARGRWTTATVLWTPEA